MKYANQGAAAIAAARLIGRGSGVEIVSNVQPGRLCVGEIIDKSRTEWFELGRAVYWIDGYFRIGPFRGREL